MRICTNSSCQIIKTILFASLKWCLKCIVQGQGDESQRSISYKFVASQCHGLRCTVTVPHITTEPYFVSTKSCVTVTIEIIAVQARVSLSAYIDKLTTRVYKEHYW